MKPDKEQEYTGYDDKLRNVQWAQVTKEEIEQLDIPDKCKVNMKDDCDVYQIMLFKKGQKIFPLGFKPFRISWCQYAVNFPPLTAKYLYEKYTEHFKEQSTIRIWDPSAGWGGRILGAMSISDDRNIHYISTDPNTDHTVIREDVPKAQSMMNSLGFSMRKLTEEQVYFRIQTHTKYTNAVQKISHVRMKPLTRLHITTVLCERGVF